MPILAAALNAVDRGPTGWLLVAIGSLVLLLVAQASNSRIWYSLPSNGLRQCPAR